MNYSSRFWLYAPLGLFAALAIGVMIHWWMAANAMARRLDALNAKQAVPGITISYAGRRVSGFPFRLDVLLTGLRVAGAGAHGPFVWQSENFAMHALTYGRAQDIFEAAGQQSLRWTDGGGRVHALKFLPGSLRASVLIDARGLLRFDLEGVDASGSDSAGGRFTAGKVNLHMRRNPQADAVDLMIGGEDIRMDGGNIAGLFGERIQSLKLYATFTKGQGFAPLLAGRTGWPQAAAAWRMGGGQIVLGPVDIKSSGLNLSAPAFSDSGNDLRGLLDPLY